VVLFEALAGRLPFTARTPWELVRMHAATPAPPLTSFCPDLPDDVDALVARCLLKRPEQRFPTARELGNALAEVRSGAGAPGTACPARTARWNAAHWVGTLLDDRYEVHEWIGCGRFRSDIFRAIHLGSGANVAIRLWRMRLGGERREVLRRVLLAALRREARTMEVRHPNLIVVRDLGSNDDCVYIVTELVEGVSLRTHMVRKGPLPPAAAVPLVRGVADALRLLHQRGIVSGGLSPETLRVTRGGDGPEELLLSPFGLTDLTELESILDVLGECDQGDRSLEYISPEQHEACEPDARSDLYSLGLVLLEMLGGAFRGRFGEVRGARVESPGAVDQRRPAAFSGGTLLLPPELDPAWDTFFQRAVARDPAGRFESAGAFLAALP
jgi:serine/threonine-protein kinase